MRWRIVTMTLAIGLALTAMALQTQADYMDVVQADAPTYYWNWNGTGSTTANLGSAGVYSLSAPTAARTTSATSALGSAAKIENASDGASAWEGTLAATNYSSWAVEFWLNLDTITSSYITTAGGGAAPAIISGFTETNMELYINPGTASRTGSEFPSLVADTWYHVVLGYKSNGGGGADVATCILDSTLGHSLTSSSAVQSLIYNTDTALSVGGIGTNGFKINGAIDEFAVYDLSSLGQSAYETKLTSLAGHYSAATIPEPNTLALLGIGAIGLLAYAWRKRK